MLAEALVIYTCIGGHQGCKESQVAYLNYRPNVQEFLDKQTRVVTNMLPSYVVKDIVPLLALISTGTVNITVNSNTTLTVSRDNTFTVSYGTTFP